MLKRAPRSTCLEIKLLEARQSIIIDELAQSGDLDVAVRLARCQYDRQQRPLGFPWRCRSPSCLFCCRSKLLTNWRGFRLWLAAPGEETSIAMIMLNGEPLAAIRKLRKGLRDVRDRAVAKNPDWRDVAMGGLISQDSAMVLIRHHGITRWSLWGMLERRWPNVRVSEVGETMPSLTIDTGLALALARRRRGLEPVRIIIPPRVCETEEGLEDLDGPMPFVF